MLSVWIVKGLRISSVRACQRRLDADINDHSGSGRGLFSSSLGSYPGTLAALNGAFLVFRQVTVDGVNRSACTRPSLPSGNGRVNECLRK